MKLSIEFCMQWNYAPKAASLAETLLTSFRGTDRAIEHILLVPSSGGVFEVTVNEEKIYSKRETGRFPEKDEIINKLKSM